MRARELGDGIWTIEGDRVRMLGIPFGTRMTLVRLGDGSLWMHSPVALTDERVGAVQELGPLAHIVAPNKFHNLFVMPWAEHFPDARTWADSFLIARKPEIRWDRELSVDVEDGPPEEWGEDIDQVFFGGRSMLPETVFLHRSTGTVIFTDIIQNHDPADDGWFWRTGKRLNGIVSPNGGCPRDWKLTVRDKDAARRARDRILAWDFDRMIVTHGICLETGAKAFVTQAFDWLD